MTAPVPAPQLSPTAGLMNALARHTIHQLTARCAELEAALAAAKERRHALRTARDFAATEAAGYIDHTGLEGL